MKLEKLTEENTKKFLDELKSGVDSSEIRVISQATRIAVKYGFVPGYKIMRDAIDIGYFRYNERRLVCLKQYFPPATVRRFMYYLVEHSLYNQFSFHSPAGGEVTYNYYFYRHIHNNPVKEEFRVFLLELPVSKVPLSSATMRYLNKKGILEMGDMVRHYRDTKIVNSTVKNELKTLHDIYSKLDLVY